MKRREFLSATSLVTGALTGWSGDAAHESEGQREVRRRAPDRHEYYEFSPDGMECVIKRPDTPIPWMNLLNNDTFQAWLTQRGYHECLMGDRGLNGLTNPQEQSGNLYFRDCDTGRYFLLNQTSGGCTVGMPAGARLHDAESVPLGVVSQYHVLCAETRHRAHLVD